jgi:hypothetical protein
MVVVEKPEVICLSLPCVLFFPSPLLGEGGRDAQHRGRVRGLSLRIQCLRIETPHPALRATFSHKGRREEIQFAVGGIAAAGWATACGARPTMTVMRPFPHRRFAAFLASSRVTASTMARRFSI